MRLSIVLACAALMLSACGQNSSADQTVPTPVFAAPKTAKELVGRVPLASAWIETEDQFPDDFEAYGTKTMSEINGLTYWAGVAAVDETTGCDRVEVSNLSSHSTPDALEWIVDCTNGDRVTFYGFAPLQKAKQRWGTEVAAITPKPAHHSAKSPARRKK